MKHASALMLLAAVALPGLAVAAQTSAEQPKPLGVFKSWTAATYGSGADKACYAFATAKAAKDSKAVPAMLTVTERASYRDEVSLSQGVAYSKDAKVTLAVGTANLGFFTKGSMAYALDSKSAVRAFLAGASVTATATAPHAKPVTDDFGLDGFSDAYKAIVKACPAK
ncbi:MAG TPA: invasion associated locus B family protein [Acidiphilium sp.]